MPPQENKARYFVELGTRDILALMELIGQWGCTLTAPVKIRGPPQAQLYGWALVILANLPSQQQSGVGCVILNDFPMQEVLTRIDASDCSYHVVPT